MPPKNFNPFYFNERKDNIDQSHAKKTKPRLNPNIDLTLITYLPHLINKNPRSKKTITNTYY